jgi:hypothetical protein
MPWATPGNSPKCADEHKKHRHPEHHRFLRAAQVQQREEHDDAEGKLHLPNLHFHREHAEDRIRASRHAQGDGQNVIADQRAAGHDTDRR